MKKEIIIFIVLAVLIVVSVVIFVVNSSQKNSLNQNGAKNETKINETKTELNQQLNTQKNMTQKSMKHLITIKTNFGDIQFETFDNDAPKTVANFITLADKGFYNSLIFHRIIKGFMIQGGDPTGTGMGGPGYQFEDELNPETESYKIGYQKGIVAMANAGPNTNGSQFFIMLENYPLPHNYTIFGKVVNGQEIVAQIGDSKTDSNDKPLSQVIMEKVLTEEL